MPVSQPRDVPPLVRRAPLLLLVVIVVAGSWVTIDPPYESFTPIRSDGLGYYSWTDALLDGNFDFCQWSQLQTVTALSGQSSARRTRCLNQYSPAMALLRLPVTGPVALISGHGSAERLVVSDASEQADQWLGVATLLAAAWLMWATLRRLKVGTWTAQLTVLCLVFGTGLFHYATFDSSFTHDTSAALFAALTFVGAGAMRDRRSPNAWLVAVLALFISWVRQPNILPLMILVAAWCAWRTAGLKGGARTRAALLEALPALAGVAGALLFQLLYVHWATDEWSFNSYGQNGLSLSRLQEWNVLFSYNHGLFLWYPVLALMLVVALWHRASRNWG